MDNVGQSDAVTVDLAAEESQQYLQMDNADGIKKVVEDYSRFTQNLTRKFRNSRSSRTSLLPSKSFLFNSNYTIRCHVTQVADRLIKDASFAYHQLTW